MKLDLVSTLTFPQTNFVGLNWAAVHIYAIDRLDVARRSLFGITATSAWWDTELFGSFSLGPSSYTPFTYPSVEQGEANMKPQDRENSDGTHSIPFLFGGWTGTPPAAYVSTWTSSRQLPGRFTPQAGSCPMGKESERSLTHEPIEVTADLGLPIVLDRGGVGSEPELLSSSKAFRRTLSFRKHWVPLPVGQFHHHSENRSHTHTPAFPHR